MTPICQKFEAADRPDTIDVSSNTADYLKAGLVISPTFSDEFNGIFDKHESRHRASLNYLALNPAIQIVQDENFRKFLGCIVNQEELVRSYRIGRLGNEFFSIKSRACDAKTRAALWKRIPRNLRESAFTITIGQNQPYYQVLARELNKSGIKVSLTTSKDAKTELAQILAIPIFALEPGMSIKNLCKNWNQQIPSCREGVLRDKILSHAGNDFTVVTEPLFHDQYMVPLLYAPYYIFTRKGFIDHFEENATEFLNLDTMIFSFLGSGTQKPSPR